MKKYNLIHLGIGKVGKALVHQILNNRQRLRNRYSIDLNYCGLFNSKGGIFNPNGLALDEIDNFPAKINTQIAEALKGLNSSFILIDTTSSDETYYSIISTLKKGASVVLSNKRPLVRNYSGFKKLNSFGPNRLLFETTVGAGLPDIRTLNTLLATGDEVIEITGCLSGTLGFICSSLEEGLSFSESAKIAGEKGFTEADPRDDLCGADVARKAVILARKMGLKIELPDIKIQPLYPKKFNSLSVEQFMSTIKELDYFYKKKFQKASSKGSTYRFVAKISKKGCSAGLMEVSMDSDVGCLKGPDNIIVFKTARYSDRLLVIKGPGAGPEVTAAGVFGDILQIAGVI